MIAKKSFLLVGNNKYLNRINTLKNTSKNKGYNF
jgi:hypothetical protein